MISISKIRRCRQRRQVSDASGYNQARMRAALKNSGAKPCQQKADRWTEHQDVAAASLTVRHDQWRLRWSGGGGSASRRHSPVAASPGHVWRSPGTQKQIFFHLVRSPSKASPFRTASRTRLVQSERQLLWRRGVVQTRQGRPLQVANGTARERQRVRKRAGSGPSQGPGQSQSRVRQLVALFHINGAAVHTIQKKMGVTSIAFRPDGAASAPAFLGPQRRIHVGKAATARP